VLVHDASERYPATAVDGAGVPGVPATRGGSAPVVYERHADGWVQYWIWYRANPQDRGILRSGRHAGDWELVQYRTDGSEAVYAQHSGAERCGRRDIEFRGGRPVVYVANGSHASYFHAGVRDRMWPDPNDEADGRGRVTVAPVVEITRTNPRWMTDPEPWGNSRANRFLPMEQDSPPGPYFQPTRWDAETFATDARDCQAGCDEVGECDGPEKTMTAGAIALLAVAALTLRRAWSRRRRPPGDATG